MSWPLSPRPSRPRQFSLESLRQRALALLNPSNWAFWSIVGGGSWVSFVIALQPILNHWGGAFVVAAALSCLLLALLLLLVRPVAQSLAPLSDPVGPTGLSSVEALAKRQVLPGPERQVATPNGGAIQKQRDQSSQPFVGSYAAPLILDNPILAWQMSRLTGQSHLASSSPKDPVSSRALTSPDEQPEPDDANS